MRPDYIALQVLISNIFEIGLAVAMNPSLQLARAGVRSEMHRRTVNALAAMSVIGVLVGCASGSPTQLGSATGAELLAEGHRLSAEEVRKIFYPGSKVVRRTPEGYVHYWTNEENGTFVSHTESSFAWGHGKWVVHDDTYCTRIDWITKDNGKIATEAYCYSIYSMKDRLFQAAVNVTPAMASQKFGEIRITN